MLKPLQVAFLCSRRAPGLLHVLGEARRRRLFEVVCCLSTEESFAEQREAETRKIPCVTHPIRSFYAAHGRPVTDLGLRESFDAETLDILRPFAPDVLVLASYLYILTPRILDAFPGSVVNVHHADLTLLGSGGTPRYAGLRAVRDAVFDGATETRATSHVVTETLDAGPPLLRSWAFPIAPLATDGRAWRAMDMLKAYAYAHQEWMLRSAWGPLLAGSLALIAERRMHLMNGRAWIDGIPGPLDLAPDGQPDAFPAVLDARIARRL